jgi:hypothetical protein
MESAAPHTATPESAPNYYTTPHQHLSREKSHKKQKNSNSRFVQNDETFFSKNR